MTANDKRAERRVPVALRIRLRYQAIDQFISKFAINISRGGMFLSSRNPKAIGTRLQFEMRLADDSPVIEGTGEVRWIREYDRDQPNQPHGMGIRFLELKPDSHALIERIIEHRRSVGDMDDDSIPEPRMLPRPPPPIAAPREDPAPEPPAREPPVPLPDPLPPRAMLAPAPPLPDIPAARRRSPSRTGEVLGAIGAELPPLDVALARARRVAGQFARGDLERELAALLDETAVPVEVTVDAASRELAERLGGEAVARRPPLSVDDVLLSLADADDDEPPEPVTTQLPELPPIEAKPPRPDETTGSALRVDPADVLEEVDEAQSAPDPSIDVDVDLSDFASENEAPTSVGDPDEPLPSKKRLSLRQRLSGKH